MAVLIIFPVILQTVINIMMLSIGGQGIKLYYLCQGGYVFARVCLSVCVLAR